MDVFFDNAITKSVASLVNFCNEQTYFCQPKLKFLKNMPINKVEITPPENRFLFKVNK